MVKTLEDLGYTVYTRLLRSQFLDVPQKRERLFIIALDKSFSHPAFFPKERDYTVSMREALADCPPSPGQKYPEKKAKIMALHPAGRLLARPAAGIATQLHGGEFSSRRWTHWHGSAFVLG